MGQGRHDSAATPSVCPRLTARDAFSIDWMRNDTSPLYLHIFVADPAGRLLCPSLGKNSAVCAGQIRLA